MSNVYLAYTSIEAAGAALPPGFEKVNLVITWVTGILSITLYVAFLASLGVAGISALSRGEFHGGKGSIIILFCAAASTAATAIFGALGLATG